MKPLLVLALLATTASAAPTYKEDIQPLFKAHCTKCHGFLVKQKGLDLRKLKAIKKGGESGPSIVPGDPAKSLLIQGLNLPKSDIRHMPPAAEKQLTPAQIKLLTDWVASGAK